MSIVRAFIGQHFAFASGRTAVLQQHLVDQSDVDRLLGSHDIVEFERILAELELTQHAGRSATHAEEILSSIESWMRTEVDTMTPPAKRPIFSVLWMSGDAPRLSYLLKASFGLTSEVSAEPESGVSAWDPILLREAVKDPTAASVAKLPSELLDFIKEVKAGACTDPKEIDRAVAFFIAERRLALARSGGSSDIVRYVRHLIDTTNIRTALRGAETAADDRRKSLIPGGFVPVRELLGTSADIAHAIDRSELYAPFIPKQKGGSVDAPLLVEHVSAKILADDISRMWNVPLTVEPIFAFAALVLSHVRLLRAIFIGKRNRLSPQEIKKILPPFIPATHYVS